MVCTHLRQLYHLCEENGVRISSSDLVRIVCEQCGVQEVCPSMLMMEYDSKEHEPERAPVQLSVKPTESIKPTAS